MASQQTPETPVSPAILWGSLEDSIHDHSKKVEMAPAQPYTTESGQLFHAGRLVVVMVGLPARGKTHISVSLARFLKWLGVPTGVFHLGDFRRETIKQGEDIPHDYFFVNASPETIALRNDIANNCLKAIYQFFDEENGQVAIYDAVNALAADREALAKQFAERDINIMFIESVCDDPKIIENNVKRVKVSSPDFAGWDKKDAVDAYLARVAAKFPHFETIQEKEYYYVKMINAGECIQVNRKNSGYLHGRILFYLMNFHINTRRIYFANSGESEDEIRHKADAPLSKDGEEYALKMVKAIMIHRAEEIKNGEPEGPNPLRPLVIWTSQQQKSIQSGEIFAEMNFPVREMPQLTQLHPGIRETISDAELEVDYPGELENHAKDPYRHRFYRAESYLDVALRLEPVIMQLEREDKDVLIITHESVIRVLYAYLMSCNSSIIPFLSFPRNQILEVIPGSYKNKSNVIKIFDTTEDTLASCAATYPVKKNADTPAESNEQLSKLDIVADSLVNERSKVGLQENKNTD